MRACVWVVVVVVVVVVVGVWGVGGEGTTRPLLMVTRVYDTGARET